jgi:hypothetical protein
MSDYDVVKKEVIAELEGAYSATRGMEWNGTEMKKLAPKIIIAVERVVVRMGGLPGKDKKQLVIDTINHFVDIPFVPESLEDNLIAMIAGPAIDWIVAAFNHVFGKTWEKLFGMVLE